MNQLEAYGKASTLSLENAEVWLSLARESFKRERNGHAYSTAVIANEEVVKAFVSWLVSQEYISANDESVKAVYRYHVDKGAISLGFHYEVIVQDALKAGLIDMEEALGAIVTVPPDRVAETLWDHAKEIEERRKAGVYVSRPREVNGVYTVTSPSEFPKTKAENMIDLVNIFHKSVSILLEAIEKDEKVRDWFETELREISKLDHF